jgi:hypothetical protein
VGVKNILGDMSFELLECDKPTVNGRIYPRELVEKMVAEHQDRIKQRRFFCYPNFGDRETGEGLIRVSHVLTSLEVKDDKVIGSADILNTPAGREIFTEISEGIVGVAMGGVGKIESNTVVEFSLLDVAIRPREDIGLEPIAAPKTPRERFIGFLRRIFKFGNYLLNFRGGKYAKARIARTRRF